jgi:hypothetical protein
MFKVKISGKVLTFRFRHSDGEQDVLTGNGPIRRRYTSCSVLHASEDLPFQVAFAICNPADQFSRRIGRKMALKKLLQRLFPDREGGQEHLWYRQLVWDKYFALGLRGEWAGG